jgi:hypothetical protein
MKKSTEQVERKKNVQIDSQSQHFETEGKLEQVKANLIEKDEHPSVEVAYDLAVKSYDLSERRLQIVEGRNEKILGYVSGLTLAVVAFLAGSNSTKLNLNSCLFITALIFGVLSLITGLLVMLAGRIKVIDIKTIKEKWIHLEEIDFKKEMLIASSKHYDENCELLEKKAQLTLISAVLFVLEIIFLIIWLTSNWNPSAS